jgi:uncharacterized protein YgfB (UPF0149 family)
MPDPRRDEDMLIVRTREAHEALRDLKNVVREVRDLIVDAEKARERLMGMIAVGAATMVDDKIEAAISTGLENYAVAIEEAIHTAEESIFDRFDKLTETLLEGPTSEAVREAWQMDQIQKTLEKKIGHKPVQSD